MQVIQKPVLETAHPVKNLPSEYSSEPWLFDELHNEWVISVTHPVFGETLVHESGYLVEKNVGFKIIVVPITKDKFQQMYYEYTIEEQQANLYEDEMKGNDFIKRECI